MSLKAQQDIERYYKFHWKDERLSDVVKDWKDMIQDKVKVQMPNLLRFIEKVLSDAHESTQALRETLRQDQNSNLDFVRADAYCQAG